MSATRPRGRPLSFDRDAALDRVLPVFWQKGFDSASLDELAAAAGLNRPNLNTAFGDKRGLYLASLERFLGKFCIGAAAALNAPDHLPAALNRFFEFAVSIYSEQGLGCFVFVTAPAASDDPDIRAGLGKALRLLQAAIEQRLERAIGDELASNIDVKGLAISLSGVLLSLALHGRAGVPATELSEMHQCAVRTILKGVTSR